MSVTAGNFCGAIAATPESLSGVSTPANAKPESRVLSQAVHRQPGCSGTDVFGLRLPSALRVKEL